MASGVASRINPAAIARDVEAARHRRATLIEQPQFRIRRGEPADLAALREIECTVFEFEQLTGRAFRRFLQLPGADLMVAELDSAVVGYGLVSYRKGSWRGHLASLAVITHATARGIGMALLDELNRLAIARGATALRLEVRSDNAAAISLYARAGYRNIGMRPRFYADECDALVYELVLADTSGASD